MLIENVRIHEAVYGIYRPAFDNQVYRNLSISNVVSEPFNRSMDDASAQAGQISVDGLTFTTGHGNKTTPLIQISDVNLSGHAATHLRNVTVHRSDNLRDRWPLLNRGVGTRVPPITMGVPVFIHDYYGAGRHAKVVSTAAKDLIADGSNYRQEDSLTSDESRVAEVSDVGWPELLNPTDDLPPATIITFIGRSGTGFHAHGMTHDNGDIVCVEVSGKKAELKVQSPGVVEWTVVFDSPLEKLVAVAIDNAGNREITGHEVALPFSKKVASSTKPHDLHTGH